MSSLLGWQAESPKTELTLRVDPTGQSGVYTVSGQTNLPNQTRLTIQAIRKLNAPNTGVQLSNSQPTYTILSRSQVEVMDGKWQTTLNLLQKAPDGQAVESWQPSDRQLKLNLQPENQVTFLAVTDPSDSAFEIRQQPEGSTQDNLSVRFTADGKSYLQAEQALNLEAPAPKLIEQTANAAIVKVATKPINKSTAAKPQIDTALSPKEWMR